MGFLASLLKDVGGIIKEDFLALVRDFFSGNLDIECLNTSLITLIPKKLGAERINDYRPISLTNACLKFMTKFLANRLQVVILKCIHRIQYGFLKCRSIQDCLACCY